MTIKKIGVRIVLYTLLSVTIFGAFWLIAEMEDQAALRRRIGHISPMGNILSAYFFITHTAQTDDPLGHKNMAAMSTNHELKRLYKKLDWNKKYAQVDFVAKTDDAWHEIGYDHKPKPNYLLFWQTVRPTMQQIYAQNIKPVDITVPVVHFRCSDSPFNKHLQYHIPKTETVKWMADQVKERGYKQVVILCCNRHWSKDNNNSCDEYANFYGQIFKDAGIDYSIQCNSIMQDFAMMVYTPLLISLNQSSYSFIAGVSKDPKNYISCNMGRETHEGYILQQNADWILDNREPLLHTEVKDYNNPADVIKKLG
jgi:hypothetical protein